MLQTVGLLLCCAAIIYIFCELFVNGIEWLGQKLQVGATAVGTILAAFGTALPESVVTLIAVFFGETGSDKDIGVGSAMGGPLVLATLAYGVVGFGRRATLRTSQPLDADTKRLAFDQSVFLGTFCVKVALGCVVFAGKPYAALFFLIVYAAYLYHELSRDEALAEVAGLEPLKFAPKTALPSLAIVLTQVALSVAVIAWAAQVFVVQLKLLGEAARVPPHIIALVCSPLATELPEMLNASIWVRQGKERLALANISGSMMIQATIPSAMGIAFTPWLFDAPLLAAAGITMTAIAFYGWRLSRGQLLARDLMFGPPLYVLMMGYLLLHEMAH